MIKIIKKIKDKLVPIGKFLLVRWLDVTIFTLSFVISWILFDMFAPEIDFLG